MMLLRLATIGALGYAAFKYYEKNRKTVGGALGRSAAGAEDYAGPAGGPISDHASVVHPGENPVD